MLPPTRVRGLDEERSHRWVFCPDGTAAAATTPEPLGNELREFALATRYRLTTERQTRSGELHYFDHPAFGVLVKVTPVQPTNSGSTGRRPAA